MSEREDHRRRVAERYAAAARRISHEPAAVGSAEVDTTGRRRYAGQLDPDLEAIAAGSIGCGNPVAVADLQPGDTVLDLGSGAGLDVVLSARRVGPTGRAIGLDMTHGMLELARRNAREAGVTNAEFHLGDIEHIPLPDASVDVVISNCVIALAADKHRVFAEIRRVLRPGGRVGISDVIAADHRTADHAGECGETAATEADYHAVLRAAGLRDVSISRTHEVGNGLHAAIIKAVKHEH